MNMFDFLLLAIIGWSIVAGFLSGFAKVGIGFAATVLGILFGFWFYYIPGAWIREYFRSETASNLLGFFAVFACFVIAGSIVGSVLSRALKAVGLSFLDRFCGAAFGLVRGGVLAVAVVTVVTAFAPAPPPRFIVESRVMPYATTASSVMAWLAPRSLKDAYRESVNKLHGIWSGEKQRRLKGESI